MRGCLHAAVVIGSIVCAGAEPAHAQASAARPDRVRIGVSAGVQPSPTSFGSSTTTSVYLEASVVDTAYTIANGRFLDGGAAIRLAGSMWVGVAVSRLTTHDEAGVHAAIPHPFFYHAPRSVDGTASGLRRDELVTHLQVVDVIRPTRDVEIALAAGPSFFKVTQAFVYDVTYADTYPYDLPAFTTALSREVSGRRTGFNASADITLRLSPGIGVGGLLRFSRAQVQFAVPNSGAAVTSKAGGLQAGAGLRLYF